MLCDECKQRQATYHKVTNVNGVVSEEHLCSVCEQKRKNGADFPLFDALFNNFGLGELPSSRPRKTCINCGMSLEDFFSVGEVGCEKCYDEFASQILPRIQRCQPRLTNVSKAPVEKKKERSPEYIKLKQDLAKALEIEDYEKAAQIHEQIKKMEKEDN